MRIALITTILLSSLISRGQIVDKIKNKADSAIVEAKASLIDADTSKLTHRIYDDLTAGLRGIASALKVGVEHVYIILVKQQIVKAVVNLLIILTLIVLFIIAINLFRHGLVDDKVIYKERHNTLSGFDAEDWGAPTWIPFITSIIVVIIFIPMAIFSVEGIVTGFINPEYGAIMDIIEFVKPKKGC
jgi:hypothetical protein